MSNLNEQPVFGTETHDLDVDEDECVNTTPSCSNSANGIIDVDSGNSSSHSPSPDDTYQSINTQSCQKRPSSISTSNEPSHCRSGNENSTQRSSPSLSGKAIYITSYLLIRFQDK